MPTGGAWVGTLGLGVPTRKTCICLVPDVYHWDFSIQKELFLWVYLFLTEIICLDNLNFVFLRWNLTIRIRSRDVLRTNH